jgi:hypothetical protein
VIVRHNPGLTASPPARYMLRVARRESSPCLLLVATRGGITPRLFRVAYPRGDSPRSSKLGRRAPSGVRVLPPAHAHRPTPCNVRTHGSFIRRVAGGGVAPPGTGMGPAWLCDTLHRDSRSPPDPYGLKSPSFSKRLIPPQAVPCPDSPRLRCQVPRLRCQTLREVARISCAGWLGVSADLYERNSPTEPRADCQ